MPFDTAKDMGKFIETNIKCILGACVFDNLKQLGYDDLQIKIKAWQNIKKGCNDKQVIKTLDENL